MGFSYKNETIKGWRASEACCSPESWEQETAISPVLKISRQNGKSWNVRPITPHPTLHLQSTFSTNSNTSGTLPLACNNKKDVWTLPTVLETFFFSFFYHKVFIFDPLFEQKTFLEGKPAMQLQAPQERGGVLLLRWVQMRPGTTTFWRFIISNTELQGSNPGPKLILSDVKPCFPIRPACY